MKKYIKLISKLFVIVVLLQSISIINNRVCAADLSVSANGNSVTISSEYTGKVNISVNGGTASETTVWLENSSKTITISNVDENGATVTVTPSEIKDTDGNSKTALSDSDGKIVPIGAKSVSIQGNKKETSTNENPSNNKTTEKEPTFKSSSDTLYSTGSVNVRKSYSTDSAILGHLEEGEEVKREATGDNGWSRIVYKGATGYVKTSLLTNEKPKEKSTDKALKSLEVKPEGLSPEFNPETTSYSLQVGADVKKLDIKAVANDEKSKVEISGNDELKDGDNTVKITVTAEDETVRTYTIVVKKAAKSSQGLTSLSIKKLKLSPNFSTDVLKYTVDVTDSSITKLDIDAISEDKDATVEISGNEDLKVGKNTITIKVKAKDSDEEVTYTIIVNKKDAKTLAANKSENNKNNKMPLFIGIGIIAVLLIVIIVVIVKHKRNNDYYDDEDEEEYNNDMYGYGQKKVNNIQEDKLGEKDIQESNKQDDEFNYNPYSAQNMYDDFNDKSNNDDPNKELFGTMNGVDESYGYTNVKDDLSEAINTYKEQEVDDRQDSKQYNSNYEEYLNGFNDDGDEYKSRRSRGKHTK